MLRAKLHGVVTAPDLEAVHLRLAARTAAIIRIDIDPDALLAVTARSAVEAAIRGTPARLASRRGVIGVCQRRHDWACVVAQLLTDAGLPRSVVLAPAAGLASAKRDPLPKRKG